jgi:hypothetical protein
VYSWNEKVLIYVYIINHQLLLYSSDTFDRRHVWYVYVSDIDTTQTCVITFNNVIFSNCYRCRRVSVVFVSIYVASTLLIKGVSGCSTHVSIWHRHMWLHWIMSLPHIIIGVDVSLSVSCPVSVSLCASQVSMSMFHWLIGWYYHWCILISWIHIP